MATANKPQIIARKAAKLPILGPIKVWIRAGYENPTILVTEIGNLTLWVYGFIYLIYIYLNYVREKPSSNDCTIVGCKLPIAAVDTKAAIQSGHMRH